MAITFTATPDVSNARILINAQGGVTGDRFYMIRRDQNGANLIRETSEAGALWLKDVTKIRTNLATNPGMETASGTAVVRTNLATNPDAASVTSYSAVAGTGGTAAITNQSSGGHTGTNFNRVTWSVATTAVSGGCLYGSTTGLTAGLPYATSIWVKSSIAQRVYLGIDWNTAGGGYISSTAGAAVNLTANVWTQLFATGTAPATATQANLSVLATTGGGVVWPINATLDVDDVLFEYGSVLRPNFSGVTAAAGDFTYAWTGTANASTSTQLGAVVVGTAASAGSGTIVGYQTKSTPKSGLNSARLLCLRPVPSGGAAEIDYIETVSGTTGAVRSAKLSVRSSAAKNVTLALTFMNGGSPVGTVSATAALSAGAWSEISVNNAISTGSYTSIKLSLIGTAAGDQLMAVDDYVDIDNALIEAVAAGGMFFDGTTGPNCAWTGAANASTSTCGDAALPMTLNDYEARQGLSTDYILTDKDGLASSSVNLTIPSWGTWLKDPFRPFMNVKVYWNSDSEYIRKIEKVTLRARGAKYPVVQYDRRMAPEGTIRILTEDSLTSRALTAMLDTANIVMIDVDGGFGVPVRYVSVGDLTGSRTGAADRDLKYEARYWDLPIQEVAMPVGAPVAQLLTYDSLAAAFGSYIAIPATTDTYNDLAAGNWS